MADEWRATVTRVSRTVRDVISKAVEGLPWEVPDEVHNRLGERVAVSRKGASFFLYADSAEVAREAGRIAHEVFSRHDLPAEVVVQYWDAISDAWLDAAGQGPPSAEEVRAYRAEQERVRSQEIGVSLWQVRVELRCRHDTVALLGQLTVAGTSVIRRRKVLIAGADSEEDARELADKIRGDAPPGASIHIERTGGGISWLPEPPGGTFYP